MEVQPALVERVFSPKQELNVNLSGSYTVTYLKHETTSLVIKCMLWHTPPLGYHSAASHSPQQLVYQRRLASLQSDFNDMFVQKTAQLSHFD